MPAEGQSYGGYEARWDGIGLLRGGGWALFTAFGVEEKKSLRARIVLNIFLVERWHACDY
ncbi:hypothetical protein KDA_44660 [Dictyobacter alpinus]|uniref:Uncharacterized protein n=1 Tax=Dictyobacter alpinus TaxID=2014873 RepID=A0A402BCH1_9CHLR|nr:hypothetical protein KDA_44660 [Dictyobacter alpinus]